MSDSPFSYELPADRIAQRPVRPYHEARLLVADLVRETLEESRFINLSQFLSPQDLLVLNDTRVLPVRLFGIFRGSEVEILLVENTNKNCWSCLGRPARKLKSGSLIKFGDDFSATVLERTDTGLLQVELQTNGQSIGEAIASHGVMPIPPYIRKGRADEQDLLDYQTLVAQSPGSIAAPTASLHFTKDLFNSLESKGCRWTTITLHVGTASFLSVLKDDGSLRKPGAEFVVPNQRALEVIRKTRESGGRVIAVGTTVARALESPEIFESASEFQTELFITPGYSFKVIDGLITNFHQPGTTHLLLVEAMMNRGFLSKAYHFALENEFRFLSYGDGMLII